MKKNISKLVALVAPMQSSALGANKKTFKVTSKNANEYVNKILVDYKEYHEPTTAEAYIERQMKLYSHDHTNKNVADLNDNVKMKTEKPRAIEHQLNLLEKNFNNFDALAFEELLASMRSAKKEEMIKLRGKLTKLEMNCSFAIESEDLDPHIETILNEFLKELTQILNKTNKIY